LERFNATRRRVKTNVILEGSKVDQIAIQRKCGHLIIDCFLGFRRSFLDGSPELMQYTLHVFWKHVDVFIYRFEMMSS
jgi:hypothetical protein